MWGHYLNLFMIVYLNMCGKSDSLKCWEHQGTSGNNTVTNIVIRWFCDNWYILRKSSLLQLCNFNEASFFPLNIVYALFCFSGIFFSVLHISVLHILHAMSQIHFTLMHKHLQTLIKVDVNVSAMLTGLFFAFRSPLSMWVWTGVLPCSMTPIILRKQVRWV